MKVTFSLTGHEEVPEVYSCTFIKMSQTEIVIRDREGGYIVASNNDVVSMEIEEEDQQ